MKKNANITVRKSDPRFKDWVYRYPIGPEPDRKLDYQEHAVFWNPGYWLKQDNDTVIEGVLEYPFRHGKMMEYFENIKTNESYYTRCQSARRLGGTAKDNQVVHIINAGPSLADRLDDLNDVCKDRNNITIALNQAITACCRKTYTVWSERMADATRLWQHLNSSTKIITVPHSSPTSVKYVNNGNEIYLYCCGSENGSGKLIRDGWKRLCPGKEPLLNVPSVEDTTQIAMMMAFWMGFKKMCVWGADYCTYSDNLDDYYFSGGAYPDPEYVYSAMCSSGKEGVAKKDRVMWLNTIFAIPDINKGEPCYTTPFFMHRSQSLNHDIENYREHGMEIEIMNDRGLLKI